MISVEEALEKILAKMHVLEEEEKPILECLGQVLSRDVSSGINVPQLTNSAMDGYAVRAADTKGASASSPRVLKVIDTVAAGYVSKLSVTPDTAMRIMTGAPIPAGADAVVQFENTDEPERKGTSPKKSPSEIGILEEAELSLNVRPAGEDIRKGSVVFTKGTLVRPAVVGMLASIGIGRVWVIRRPVIAILATGDELSDIGEPLPPGKIYNSNSYSVAALVLKYGGIPKPLGIGRDNEKDLTAKIGQAKNADMLITSGGVSMGDYDMVKNVLAKEGEIGFWTVRMKPGKPLAFGTIHGKNKAGQPREIPHLGLPGNPVSSMVTFEIYVRPAMFKMMGRSKIAKPVIEAVMEDTARNSDGRRFFTRAIVTRREGKYYAHLTGDQGSGILTSMSLANGLAIVPEDRKKVSPGEIVKVMMLDWDEE
jgi:molybdopterin molybdotransferase